jgi:hypothetical protein
MPAHYGVVLVETSNQPGNHDSCFSGADRRRINLSRPGSLYGPRVSWRDTSSRSGCGCSSLLSVPHDDELAVSSSSTRGIGAAGCVVPRQRVTGVSGPCERSAKGTRNLSCSPPFFPLLLPRPCARRGAQRDNGVVVQFCS